MELYICRHGETEWTLSGRHTGRTDILLTENGKKQASLLGERLASTHFDVVYSSPRQRALDTCQIVGLESVVDPDLAEWDYGEYEGLTHNEIQQKDPGWTVFERGAPHGESVEAVGKRADRFLKKLSPNLKRVAIFSHGHFSRVLTARWLGLPADQGCLFLLSVASLSILGYERTHKVLRIWNDTSHLQ